MVAIAAESPRGYILVRLAVLYGTRLTCRALRVLDLETRKQLYSEGIAGLVMRTVYCIVVCMQIPGVIKWDELLEKRGGPQVV